MLVDSHCHLSFEDYSPDEIDGMLERASDNDVSTLITIGAGEGFEGNAAALEVAKKYPQVYCTMGLHPHDASCSNEEVDAQLKEMAQHEKVVAIGEIGLDFHYNNSPDDVQRDVLRRYIRLAFELNKPIVIHDRDAGDETYEILKEEGVQPDQVMIHCFTGTAELAKKYLDLGCFLSFTGIITFKSANELREVVQNTPVERMLIETDSPFLTPVPFRGKKNEPAHVKLVAEKIAEIKGLSFSDVARITTLNAKRFFNLPQQEMTTSIAYAIRNSLYLNITNRCTLACRFCPKFVDYEVKGYYLKLNKEPSVDEIVEAMGDFGRYDEVVFCGYGESTRRLDVLLEVAARVKEQKPEMKVRLNMDGLGNLVHERNIIPDLAKVGDALSISMNAQDAQTYAKHCPSKYKEKAYPAVKSFIKEAVGHFDEVVASVVGLPDVDREKCQQIVEEELGAKFRYREHDNVG